MSFYKIFYLNLILLCTLTLSSKSQGVSIPDSCPSYYDSTLNKTIFIYVDEMPEYQGGLEKLLEFFNKNFRYPKQQEDFQARFYLTFIIETDGTMSNITTVQKNRTLADNEAIRVFKLMPAWKAGQCHGKPVPVKLNLPINFTHH